MRKHALFFFIIPFIASAAAQPLVHLRPLNDPAVGRMFSVEVGVESEEPLNAYSILVSYPTEFLEFSGSNDMDSVVDVWQKRPGLIQEGVIALNGGSFEPYKDDYGKLLTLHFVPLKEGETSILLPDSIVYRADGAGTPQSPLPLRLGFRIAPGTGVPAIAEDDTPPQIAFSEIIPDPFESNQKLLAFRVADSATGVKEALVRSRSFIGWGKWQNAENPAQLPHMAWAVNLRVVDNGGNISEAIFYDWKAFLGLVFLIGILVSVLFAMKIHLLSVI